MNMTENINISALIIDVDAIICGNIPPDGIAHDSSVHIAPNEKLIRAIENILYNGIAVFWISDTAKVSAKHAIKATLGNLHEKIPIIGRESGTAGHDPYFYERLVQETLKNKNIAPNEAILISNQRPNGDTAPAITKLYTIAIIDSPEKLVQYLKYVNFCSLFNGTC